MYWTDTSLEKIEMVNLDDHTIRFINLQEDDNYHFFGITTYFEDIYFTDIPSDGVYAAEFPIALVQVLNLRLRTPTEIHIYAGNIFSSEKS